MNIFLKVQLMWFKGRNKGRIKPFNAAWAKVTDKNCGIGSILKWMKNSVVWSEMTDPQS